MTADVSIRAELAARILRVDGQRPDRPPGLSTVWRSGHLPPELPGDTSHGEDQARWAPPGAPSPRAADRLVDPWAAALPLNVGMRGYLGACVNRPADVRHLRAVGDVDGLGIASCLDAWRWLFRPDVVLRPFANAWLNVAQRGDHHAHVFDAEPFVGEARPGRRRHVHVLKPRRGLLRVAA
ncbi:hypothetical protein [Pseudonocardia hierapolitana]|uniref:hypothetical protein n=1 Tax=Pseudonocardia hierapolitana TaxID=1128676 RepID=UPI001BB0279E|nr:hypothetical protein [Pseudonocardia hierapolitana]